MRHMRRLECKTACSACTAAVSDNVHKHPGRNLCRVLPCGTYHYKAEVKSGLQYPHIGCVVYPLGRPQKRYVVIEVDPLEHRANGLVEDVIDWFHNARFQGGKLYVLSVNPSQNEHADGVVANPTLRERLRRVLQLLQFVYDDAAGENCSIVRCYYLHYSASRLAQFMDKVACELVEVERDVLHFLTFRSQGYFKKEHVGEKKISSQGLPILGAGVPAEEWRPFDQLYEVSAAGVVCNRLNNGPSRSSCPWRAILTSTLA